MKYKPLSVDTLPHVFVNLLAQEDVVIVVFTEAMNECEEMKTWFETTKTKPIGCARTMLEEHQNGTVVSAGYARKDLAVFFLAVLNLSKPVRGMFVKDFDRLLNELGTQNFWGTEGQCDPRGDRRDADPDR